MPNHVVVTIPFGYTLKGSEVFQMPFGSVFQPQGKNKEEADSSQEAQLAGPDLTVSQQKVLSCLANNPKMKLRDIAQSNGLSLGTVKLLSTQLQKMGFLERVGSKAKSVWIVKSGNRQ